jgi:prevent-host-death family protein
MKTITAVEVNRQFSHLLREVREGASYLVTSHGTPVATLAPADGELRARMRARDALLARLRGSRRSTSAAGTGTNSMMTTMAATRHPLGALSVKLTLDTSILVYAEGVNGSEPRARAAALIAALPLVSVVVPVRVPGELFRVLTHKASGSVRSRASPPDVVVPPHS